MIAECGTGKTLISLGAMCAHSDGRPFTALTMVPPHIVEKWAREALHTIPGIRVFLVDSLRNGGSGILPQGVNEVMRKGHGSARKRWEALCGRPALFIVGRDRAKLGYFWRHAYRMPNSGRYRGCVVNPATGAPVMTDAGRLTIGDFDR